MDSSQAAEMRRAMARNFRELGASQHDVDDLQETLLLRSGKLAARTYKAGNLMAMWMTDGPGAILRRRRRNAAHVADYAAADRAAPRGLAATPVSQTRREISRIVPRPPSSRNASTTQSVMISRPRAIGNLRHFCRRTDRD